jgi:FlaA1/EpsC-like NDP-sugar epimerase
MMDEIVRVVDDDPRKMMIAEFFDGKNIFITGGTGFL